jgi:phosphoribosyl-dephospho-CoA transferase
VSALEIRPQVHDLIRMDPGSIQSIDAPAWVNRELRRCPWAVIRRVRGPTGLIAVGVRGEMRNERWGGYIPQHAVKQIVEPGELLQTLRCSGGIDRTPPILLLEEVIDRWQGLALPWGPTGGVGFELASGHRVTTKLSDLDIVIRASRPLPAECARSLWERVRELRPRVDVRVETPVCGFALEEYVRRPLSRILLRYPDGARIGDDPWGEHLTTSLATTSLAAS